GSLHAGSAPESLAVGSDRSILTAAAVPQPPKNLVTLPASPAGDGKPSETQPDPVSVSVAESQISARSEAPSEPAGGHLMSEDEAGPARPPPPVPSSGIALSSPADGLNITSDDPPVIVVEGSVADSRTTTLWVVANDRRIPVRVSDGRFRTIVPAVQS